MYESRSPSGPLATGLRTGVEPDEEKKVPHCGHDDVVVCASKRNQVGSVTMEKC